MLSISAISDAGAAASYYREVDDYYRGEHAPTTWQGKGAELLGFEHEVDSQQFTALLEGRLPDGTTLGRINAEGEIEHRAGWDLTFSAPKSVSIASLVAGDERIVAAHECAVARALEHIEASAATARDKARELKGEAHATDNLTFATFRHSTSREQDPQLHTHAVLLNMTRDEARKWRSIESWPIFRMHKQAGELYRQELARELRALGYQLDVQSGGKEFNFEIRGVPADLIERFSGRSAQVEAALEARGKTRVTASAAEKEAAALDTRKGKEAMDHAELRAEWRREGRELGFDPSGERPEPPVSEAFTERERARAVEAVMRAAEHLGEREARFGRAALESAARGFAKGKAGIEAIRRAIAEAEERGELVRRETRGFDPRTGRKDTARGFTTPEAIETERRMLAAASRLTAHAPAIAAERVALEAIERREQATGAEFSAEQRQATLGVLTGERSLHLVQGLAGTAKTSSVLAAVAGASRQAGYGIKALAPTASAAQVLGAGIGAAAATVAGHLNDPRSAPGKQLWIVDEASLIGARDLQRLLARAEAERARVLLTGDAHQLGSVEAGRAFEQIQERVREAGGPVHELTEIVRQRNELLRGAVYRSVEGDARRALERIESGAGRVLEIRPEANADGRIGREERARARETRVAAIAEAYAALGREERAKTLVIAPGRDDRLLVNAAIRERLARRGELGRESLTLTALEARDLTRAEARLADCYQVDNVLKAHRDYASLGLGKGEFARVVAVDRERNRIVIENAAADRFELNPGRYAALTVYEARPLEAAAGERLVMRSNDAVPGVKNGQELQVVSVTDGRLLARDARGRAVELDGTKPLAVDHGYAVTAHQAQGRTAERVLLHAESGRVNLQTQAQLYVSISRARKEALVYTDDRAALIQQLERESGRKDQALEHRSEPLKPEPPKPRRSYTQGMSL